MLEVYFHLISNEWIDSKKHFSNKWSNQRFLRVNIVHFVPSINVLSKFNFFERSLIRKNVKNEENSKERISKEKNEFRKNVIRSNNPVPKYLVLTSYSFK